jgi:hypothetical protein
LLRQGTAAFLTFGEALAGVFGVPFEDCAGEFGNLEELTDGKDERPVRGLNPEIDPLPAFFALQHAGLSNYLHVTRNGGLGHFQNICQFTHAQRFVKNQMDDSQPGFVCESVSE